MYINLRPLKSYEPELVVYPLESYCRSFPIRVVPVVFTELPALVGSYVVLWRKRTDVKKAYDLVALVPEQSSPLPLPLPLLLQGYPLAIASNSNGPSTVLVDEAEIIRGAKGQRLYSADGHFSAVATRRVNALQIYAADYRRTSELTAGLVAHKLLEPAEGVLVNGVHIRGAWKFRQRASRSRLKEFISELGYPAAQLITLHKISTEDISRSQMAG